MRGIGEVVECRENAKMIRRERIARRTQSQIPGEAMHKGNAPSPCFPEHCLVVARRLLTGLQRDDVHGGAGDGARTRDSLLGRQELYHPYSEFFVLLFSFG